MSSIRTMHVEGPPFQLGAAFAGTMLLAALGGLSAAAEPAVHRANPAPAAGTTPAEAALDADHAAKMAQGTQLFKSTVRGILAGRCLRCHGGEKTESEFDLATREALLRGGAEAKAVEPGRPEASRLVRLIEHAAEPHMPKDAARLSPQAVAAVRRWIELGAPYDKPLVDADAASDAWTRAVIGPEARRFWSFQPLAQVEPPPVRHEAWCRTPVDRFVLARLEEKGLAPNGPAERRLLIRRAYFDLVGLPPPPEEVQRFVADDSADAYERLIDRLLDSPHHGERWARHWLDVARFAESHGFEQDYDRPHAYPYRDFVIKALNQDMPWNTFLRWQLAGDELAPDDPLALSATGFLGAGVFPTQITANEVERTRYDALDDMAHTTGTAMLGLTIGCARCHDHKFDPIPQADYYRFLSTFTTTVRTVIDVEFDPERYRRAKAAFDEAHAPLAAALARFESEQLASRLEAWEASDARKSRLPAWTILEAAEMKSAGGTTFAPQPDGSLLAGGKNPDTETYTLVFRTKAAGIRHVRIEALSDPSLPKGGPGRAANGNFALTDVGIAAGPLDAKSSDADVALRHARATFEQKGLPAAAAIDADAMSGWAVDPEFGRDHAAAFETEVPIDPLGGTTLTLRLEFKNNKQHGIGRLRVAVATSQEAPELNGSSWPDGMAEILALPRESRAPAQSTRLAEWYRTIDPQWRRLKAAVDEHLRSEPRPELTKTMICSEGLTPVRHHTQGADFFNETHFLARGDDRQKQGVASQGFLQVLTTSREGAGRWLRPPPQGARTSFRRAALADWITDTEYGAGQLAARVAVNRMWQHHFGRGVVATASDFGFQGARPTHPELLDWLARRLIEEGWRTKPLHRLIMTSAAYRQGSGYDPADARRDPDNELLWRWSPRRLEAELIRDSMLASAGLLDRTTYGAGTLDETHRRRSIYFMVKRSKLIPMMQLFDSPEPLVGVAERPVTTIAPQALLFMNNPEVRSWSQGFAERVGRCDKHAQGCPPHEAIWRGYWLALARPPTREETADTADFLARQEASYREAGRRNARDLALADFCQVLFSLNEFVYVE